VPFDRLRAVSRVEPLSEDGAAVKKANEKGKRIKVKG
jgi:hypothetical protein